jgi:hypothetical protein
MFFIFVITFELSKIYTVLTPQNDRLNLIFVKVTHAVGKKNDQQWFQNEHLALAKFGKHPLDLV